MVIARVGVVLLTGKALILGDGHVLYFDLGVEQIVVKCHCVAHFKVVYFIVYKL